MYIHIYSYLSLPLSIYTHIHTHIHTDASEILLFGSRTASKSAALPASPTSSDVYIYIYIHTHSFFCRSIPPCCAQAMATGMAGHASRVATYHLGSSAWREPPLPCSCEPGWGPGPSRR